MKHTNFLTMIAFALLFSFAANSQTEEKNFGTKDWISNGLEGKIYLLPEETQQLPDFDTMKSVGKIYTNEIDVPNRSWEEGFPGVTDRFEWFGIEYKGSFRVKKAGHYHFTISSDDGSKLFIDGQLVIDNDGLHSQLAKSAEIDLDNSTHSIKIQYFQGPRTEIGLQLFVQLDKENEEIFPGKNFKLSTPGYPFFLGMSSRLVLVFLVVFFILLFFAILRHSNRKRRRLLYGV